MDCKDLMVGDWVYIHEPECKGHRIDAIDELDGQVGADGEVYDECFIRPIPLTDEILVKNGFVYREAEETCATNAYHHWQLDGHWFALDYTQYFRKEKKDDMPRFDVAGIAIHYVHQLQHLLRLAGIEKELIID